MDADKVKPIINKCVGNRSRPSLTTRLAAPGGLLHSSCRRDLLSARRFPGVGDKRPFTTSLVTYQQRRLRRRVRKGPARAATRTALRRSSQAAQIASPESGSKNCMPSALTAKAMRSPGLTGAFGSTRATLTPASVTASVSASVALPSVPDARRL
jgi:hypothetical protein